MNDTKHTPGPWQTGANASVIRVWTELDGERHHVTILPSPQNLNQVWDEESAPITREMQMANARLIAAAPDLLAALEAALNRMEVAHKNGPFKFSMEINNAQAAISQSKGTPCP